MRANRPPTSTAAATTVRRRPATAGKNPVAIDCYCGLGPDCELFRLMTPAQRVACTRDKRATAQSFYRNGVVS